MSAYNQVAKTCLICGTSYKVKKYREATSHYCSKTCWAQRHPPDTKTCPTCKHTFTSYQRKQVYCSSSCAGKSRTGPQANAWKNGESLKRPRAKLAHQLKEWRKQIFERDNYTCQNCGAATCRLHAHHIQSWANNPTLRFDISNGTTLCMDCHGNQHDKDFSNRHTKICPVCGITTQGRGQQGLCRSCSISLWHLNQGHSVHRPPNEVQALTQLASQELR